MKNLLLLTAAFLFVQISIAQRSGELEWQKQKLPATIINVPQSASVTEAAILQKLSKIGYKPKESKGVYTIKGARITEISPELIDIYFKVERRGKKDKEESVVYFVVSKGYENYIKSTDDPLLNMNIQNYTRGFVPLAEAEGLEREIKEQEETLKSAEKKAGDLQEESESLQKRLKKLQEDIEENQKSIEKQRTEIDNQRKALDLLKAKRKN